MTLPEATDIFQVIALSFLASSLALALYIGYRVPRLRWWLVPVVLYLANGTAFYVFAVPNWWTGDARMVWSVVLRIHGAVSMFVALIVLYWLAVRTWGPPK